MRADTRVASDRQETKICASEEAKTASDATLGTSAHCLPFCGSCAAPFSQSGPPKAHSLAIGSDPSRWGLSARNPMIKDQFLDSVQGKTEQFAKRQHVTTDSCPRKRCSERKKQSAQRRNGKGRWLRTQHKCYAAEDPAKGCDKHKQRQRNHRHVDGERSQPKVSIAQRFGERPRNQVDNIVEMP